MMIIQREPKRHGGMLKPNISQKNTEIYYIKILWLLSKIFPSMLWAILYDIVMNNCEKI